MTGWKGNLVLLDAHPGLASVGTFQEAFHLHSQRSMVGRYPDIVIQILWVDAFLSSPVHWFFPKQMGLYVNQVLRNSLWSKCSHFLRGKNKSLNLCQNSLYLNILSCYLLMFWSHKFKSSTCILARKPGSCTRSSLPFASSSQRILALMECTISLEIFKNFNVVLTLRSPSLLFKM